MVKKIKDTDEFVMWLADGALYAKPLTDVPAGVVELFKNIVYHFLEFSDFSMREIWLQTLCIYLRIATGKSRTVKCHKYIYESIASILARSAESGEDIPLSYLVKVMAKWANVYYDLEFSQHQGRMVVTSRKSLRKKGIDVKVVLRNGADAKYYFPNKKLLKWIKD